MQVDRRLLLLGIPSTLVLNACETVDPTILDQIAGLGGGLTEADAAKGIKAALNNGVSHAIGKIGVLDGFWKDGIVQIPLPNTLQDVQSALRLVGADGILNELHQQLNRGAEKAVPVAKDIFVNAITSLTIRDAIDIVKGADDAATTYLRQSTSSQLAQLFSPIMENALSQTGALKLLDDVTQELSNIPFAPDLGADARRDLIGHGVDYGLKGLFHYVAEEEKAIRENPAKRTSEILRRVFG